VCPGGVISLQYADDTFLFLEKNLDKARNFKWLLACFEQLSGMRINYEKSDMIGVGLDEDELNDFANLFAAKLALSLLLIWVYPFTLTSSEEKTYNL